MTTDKPTIDTPNAAWARMQERWEVLDILLGGTPAMRDASEELLPKHERESWDKYLKRLRRSVLTEFYADGIETCVAKPFSKPLSYEGELPEALEPLVDDADLRGTNVTNFAREWAHDTVHRGLSHFLVDYPVGGAATSADIRELGLRPFFTAIPASDLRGWRLQTIRGREILTVIRFREIVTDEVGDYFEEEVEQYRVIKVDPLTGQGAFGVWRKGTDDGAWKEHESGPYKFPGAIGNGIPLVTAYTKRVGPMEARPPLEKIGHLNVRHWRSDSEQQDILQFARVGILWATGLTKEELKRGLTIGGNRWTGSTNPDAKLTIVEHTGKSIESGFRDLERLERQMQELLAERVEGRATGDVKATGQLLSEGKKQSTLGSWIMRWNQGLVNGFRFAGMWERQQLSADFQPRIHSDFTISLRGSEDINALHAMRANRDLSRPTYYEELQRRGFLSDRIDAEEESTRLDEEAMAGAELATKLGFDDEPRDPSRQDDDSDEGDADDQAA